MARIARRPNEPPDAALAAGLGEAASHEATHHPDESSPGRDVVQPHHHISAFAQRVSPPSVDSLSYPTGRLDDLGHRLRAFGVWPSSPGAWLLSDVVEMVDWGGETLRERACQR
jgi:hypothetical protein